MPRFVEELRRRNVLRVAAAYALIAWIVIEAGSVLLPTFGAPDAFFRVYVVVVIAGWFVAMVVSWVYELTPEGVKRERDIDPSIPRPRSRPGWNVLIIALLVIALGVSIGFNVTGIRNGGGGDSAVAADRSSIAVLPFSNRSADPDSQFFTDGIHDDLLTRLADIESLRVISRTSVLAYRDSPKNLRQIGEELGVGVIVEGAVQKAGEQVRINVQLIDAKTDEHLWQQTYNRRLTLENLFDLQSEISARIARELSAALTPAEERRLAKMPTTNLEAFRFYRAGRENMQQRRFETTLAARQQFEQAIELDPSYAEAHAALAATIMLLTINHTAIPPDEAYALANAAVRRALDLDPELADAYAVTGLIETQRWLGRRVGDGNLRAAAAFERALQLNPNLTEAYIWYATLNELQGDFAASIRLLETALTIDPLSRIPYVALPGVLAAKGDNDKTISLLLDAVELFPDWSVPPGYLTNQLQRMGRLDESVAWNELAVELTDDPVAGANAITVYMDFGMTDKLDAFTRSFPQDHPIFVIGPSWRQFLMGNYQAALEQLDDTTIADAWKANFTDPIAIRAAIMTGDYDLAYDLLAEAFPAISADQPLVVDRINNDAVVLLAFLERQRGNGARADDLLNAALEYMRAAPRLGMWGYGIRDVQALALLDRPEAALNALAEAIEEGFVSLRVFELWSIDETPLIDSLRSRPRYEALRSEIERRLQAMRERVEQAERDGDWQALRDRTRRI